MLGRRRATGRHGRRRRCRRRWSRRRRCSSPTAARPPRRPGSRTIFNDLALELCAPARDRLLPLCQVPLQDPDAACRELERCLAAGHVGVEIGNHVGDRDLDDAGIVTFLQHAASLGAPVFVHPWDMPQRAAPGPVDGAVAGRHAGRDAPVDPGDDPRGRVRHGQPGPADLLRPRRRLVRVLGRADGQRLAPAPRRRRHVAVPAVALPRPVLRRLGRVRRAGAATARRHASGCERVLVGSDYPYPLGERPVGACRARGDVPRRRGAQPDPARQRRDVPRPERPGGQGRTADDDGGPRRAARPRSGRDRRAADAARPVPRPARSATGEVAYFAGNSLGLQPVALRDRLGQELDDWARLGVEGHW